VRQNGFIPILIVLATVLMIGVGAFYLERTKLSNSISYSIVKPIIQPTPISSYIPTFLVPSGWKTYTNFAYGYQISFPSDWHIYSYINDNDANLCVEDYTYADKVYIFDKPSKNCNQDESKVRISVSQKTVDNLNTLHGNGNSPDKMFKLFGEDVVSYSIGGNDELSFNHNDHGYTIMVNNQYGNVSTTFRFLTPQQLAQMPTPKPISMDFIKRYYKQKDLNVYYPLPLEITNAPDGQLVGMNCSVSSNDPKIKNILSQVSKNNESVGYSSAWYCFLENGKILLAVYKIAAALDKNGEPNASVTFGLWENNSFTPKVTFNPGREAGVTAIGFVPLAYTNSNIFYYSRDFGDSAPAIEIFKIDLGIGQQTIIQGCEGVFDKQGNMQPQLSCQ